MLCCENVLLDIWIDAQTQLTCCLAMCEQKRNNTNRQRKGDCGMERRKRPAGGTFSEERKTNNDEDNRWLILSINYIIYIRSKLSLEQHWSTKDIVYLLWCHSKCQPKGLQIRYSDCCQQQLFLKCEELHVVRISALTDLHHWWGLWRVWSPRSAEPQWRSSLHREGSSGQSGTISTQKTNTLQ